MGVIRIQELKKWINDRQLEPYFCVAEDATKITESIQYNPKDNCLDGLSPKLGANGFPLPQQFPARTAADIKRSIDFGEVAPYINLIMAQTQGTVKHPGFCLCNYPAGNKYDYKDILNRWNFLADLFQCEGKCLFSYF